MLASFRMVLVAGGLTVAFFASGLFVFCTPAPVCVLVGRGRRGTGVWAAAGALTGIACLSRGAGVGIALAYGGYYVALGWLLGEGLARGWSLTRTVATAAAATTVGVALGMGAAVTIGHLPLFDVIRTHLRAMMDEVLRLGAERGVPSEQLTLLQGRADAVIAGAMRLLPAFGWVAGLAIAIGNVAVGRWVLRRYGIGRGRPGLAEWRAPFAVVWGIIGSGIAFFLDHYIVRSGALAVAAVNVLLGCVTIQAVQGLAVCSAVARRFAAAWRWVGYVALLLCLQAALPVLALIGMADTWVDFRGRMAARKEGV